MKASGVIFLGETTRGVLILTRVDGAKGYCNHIFVGAFQLGLGNTENYVLRLLPVGDL